MSAANTKITRKDEARQIQSDITVKYITPEGETKEESFEITSTTYY